MDVGVHAAGDVIGVVLTGVVASLSVNAVAPTGGVARSDDHQPWLELRPVITVVMRLAVFQRSTRRWALGAVTAS
jgi:ammonia channel protein AmtB